LIQFPSKITADYFKQVAAILKKTAAGNGHWQLCAEFRHPSWYTAKAFSMLARYNTSIVLHDMPTAAISNPDTQARVLYYRFHGPAGDYKGSYSKAKLDSYVADIKLSLIAGKDVYVYFNNTMGSAFANAQYILHKAMV
jgi:uncharacterized protein YecE (DUF72 family)